MHLPLPNLQLSPNNLDALIQRFEHTTNALFWALMAAKATGPLGWPIVLTLDALGLV